MFQNEDILWFRLVAVIRCSDTFFCWTMQCLSKSKAFQADGCKFVFKSQIVTEVHILARNQVLEPTASYKMSAF